MILGGDLTREAPTLSPASLRFILSTPLLQLQEIVLSSFSFVALPFSRLSLQS